MALQTIPKRRSENNVFTETLCCIIPAHCDHAHIVRRLHVISSQGPCKVRPLLLHHIFNILTYCQTIHRASQAAPICAAGFGKYVQACCIVTNFEYRISLDHQRDIVAGLRTPKLQDKVWSLNQGSGRLAQCLPRGIVALRYARQHIRSFWSWRPYIFR